MDRVKQYESYIEKIIKYYGQFKLAYGDVEAQTIFDRENRHYQLMTVGWRDDQRIRGILLHIDIKNGKIWIQHDGLVLLVFSQVAGFARESLQAQNKIGL